MENIETSSVIRLNKVNFSYSEGKEEPEIVFKGPDEHVYSNIKSAFAKILSLILEDDEKSVRESASSFLITLSNITTDFPGLKKIPLNKDIESVIDDAIIKAKDSNDNNLRLNIINCKYNIYTDE